MSKSVLVTGVAGFIGSHLADALLKRGDSVVGLDNLNDYYDPARKAENLREVRASAPNQEAFTFVQGDIRNRGLVNELFEQHRFATVVHLAAMAGVRASKTDPLFYFDVNLTGTINLMQAASRASDPQPIFVLASTSSVYGRTRQIPFVETNPCDRPLAPYPASKRACELIGHSFHHLYGLNLTALRFFTVYGPRNRPDMMPYLVMNNIFFGAEVELYNNGDMKRDWTYVDDIVSGVLAAADRRLGYQVINLGRGEPVALADFIDALERCAGKKAVLKAAPMDEADVQTTFADIGRARELLGYEPRTSVEEGVRGFWRWYQEAILKS